MTLTLTIDTNCINARQAAPALRPAETLARAGQLEIRSTHVLLEELASDRTRSAEARRAKAARLPKDSPEFMTGHSTVGGPDVIGGADVDRHIPAIHAIVAPGRTWEGLSPNTQADIRHLTTHHAYGRDIFVTQDKGILAHREDLQHFGIRVLDRGVLGCRLSLRTIRTAELRGRTFESSRTHLLTI